MKSIDFLCASPASTAICSSMDQRTMVRHHGTKSIDRRSDHDTKSIDRGSDHYISDHHRRKSKKNIPAIPCSSQLPINPASYYQKNRRSSSSDYSCTSASQSKRDLRSRSSAEIINDLTTTPHGSSRHLLSEKTFSELLPQTDSIIASVPSEPVLPRSLSSKEPVIPRSLSTKGPVIPRSLSFRNYSLISTNQAVRPCGQPISSNDSPALKSINKDLVVSQSAQKSESSVLTSSSAQSQSPYQVVELMVSIHCKGCEGKVRKLISKIEGVTSFSIDRETKKVTVIGEVTPLGVLSSVSKVKNAQFWPSPASSSSS